jgi:hypothetical protein
VLTCSFDVLLLAGSSLYSAAGCSVYQHWTWTQSREGSALAADAQQRSIWLSCMLVMSSCCSFVGVVLVDVLQEHIDVSTAQEETVAARSKLGPLLLSSAEHQCHQV